MSPLRPLHAPPVRAPSRRRRAFPCLLGLWLALAVATLPLATGAAGRVAERSAEVEGKLADIAREIQALTERNLRRAGRKGQLELALRRLDRKIDRLARELRARERAQREARQHLTQLERQRDAAQQALAGQRARLAALLRAQQRRLRQPAWTQLLDPASAGHRQRNTHYFRYFARARREQVQALQQRVEELARLTEAARQARTRLAEITARLQAQRDALRAEQRARRRKVDALRQALASGEARLAKLREDRAALRALLERLRFLAENPAFATPGQVRFAQLKGRLPLPAKGRISRPAIGGGIYIHAPEGTRVRAIGHGQVLFADWMRGYGLLLIINHGDGYLSLYGNNQSLFRKAGEWVEPGTVIASAGPPDGTGKGLYFEIRHKGRPLPPLQWCKRP